MELAYINSSGRQVIGRTIGQPDYYKVIDWQKKLYYLISYGNSRYEWVRCYDWGKVSNYFISASSPMEFIQDQVHAINGETTTGVKMIKQLKRLPFDIDKFK